MNERSPAMEGSHPLVVEIEAKMRYTEHAALEDRMRQAGGRFIEEIMEDNLFLDTREKKLLVADCGLRVRVEDVEEADEGASRRVMVTFKGPRAQGKLKSRREVEYAADDAKSVIALFEQLGFERVIRFQKRRRKWKMGACEVELDDLPHLGRYVEIEGPSEEEVFKVRRDLGLDGEPLIKSSYTALMVAWLEQNGVKEREVVFMA